MRLTMSLLVGLSLLALAACDKPAGPGTHSGSGGGAVANAGTDSTTPAGPSVLSTDPSAIRLTPENTKIEWVGTKNEGKHTGGFRKFAGTVELKGDDPAAAHVAVEIDTDSLTSDTPNLTTHLKSPDFFDARKFPKATFVATTFVATALKPGGVGLRVESYTVTGDLMLHGVTKSITFPATITTAPDSVSVAAEFTINRQDFGMTYGQGKVHDPVTIKLSVKAPRK